MQINKVLWVISTNQTIVPVRIVEKITKETSTGTETEFVTESVNGKRVALSDINGRYFESSGHAHDHLMSAAQSLITGLIRKAEEAAKRAWHTSDPQQEELQEIVQNEVSDVIMNQEAPETITLPDGRQAKVRYHGLGES